MATQTPPTAVGLTSGEASARLTADGPNVLPTRRPPSQLRRLLAQMVHFFALMLWAAGGLAFIAGLPELGVAIFVVIVINGVFAFVQEHRAERAAARLQDLIPRRARVVRDGLPTEISSEDLVVGDLVLLESGDRISADLAATAAHGLSIDTSTLTGESVPESAQTGDAILAGTFVVEGDGTAVVTATAGHTRLAGIAELTQTSTRPPGPLAAELHRVVRLIALIAIGVGTTFFALALALGTDPGDGFVFAIGVTVALVPEGLLPTVTLSLAVGAQRMAERDALVRRLESVETLGSTTCICTDKTGTLTQNEMAVVEVWTPDGGARVQGRGYEPDGTIDADDALLPALRDLAVTAVRCSTGRAVLEDGRWIAHGDPMEAALDAFAKRLGVEGPAHAHADGTAHRFPFDPRRRRMSLALNDRVLTKGAPDAVLPLCDPAVAARAADVVDDLATRGLRMLAIAARPLPGHAPPATAEDAERDLQLLGLVALEDPPRPEAAEAIAGARAAGVHILMITGDHPQTALAIAREVGFTDGGEAVLGADLPDDEAELGALLDHDGLVVARVSPEQKLRIARALRARGHVVAMTGDGVNDGPALQEADIGIAMGRSGTDVAREAADLVLLDDNFETIVDAIAQGRATFLNIRRFLTYHLTANVAELTPFLVWALSTGNIPLALGVLQILCIDLVTDIAPSAALGAEPPSARVLHGEPPRGRLLNRSVLRRSFALLGPTVAVVEMAAFGVTLLAAGWSPADGAPDSDVLLAASGAAFSAVVIGQAANAFACRSSVTVPWRLDRPRNPLLLWAVGSMFGFLALFLFVPPLADLLEQAPPTLLGAAVALLAAPAVLLADAADKARRATASA